LVRGSDGEGKVGESDREPMAQIEVDGEFIVAAAEVLDEGVSGTALHLPRATTPSTGQRSRQAILGPLAVLSAVPAIAALFAPPGIRPHRRFVDLNGGP
jgi:hypothetical protein